MNTREAGWYDDPQDANLLRYWDGVTWTEHTSPRQKPDLDQASTGSPADPYAAGTQQQGQPPQYPSYGAPQGQQGDPYGAPQGQQGGWGQPMPGGGYTTTVSGPTTPDGQPIASWGMRLLARILDAIIVGVIGSALSTAVVPGFFDNYTDWITSGTTSGTMPSDVASDFMKFSLIIAVLGFVYELLMLKFLGATVGKLATGLRVRLRDEPGPLSWGTSAIRAAVWQGPSLLSMVQTLSYVTGLFNLLNGLWPLWDSKKQSLNDKFAKTNVVRKRG